MCDIVNRILGICILRMIKAVAESQIDIVVDPVIEVDRRIEVIAFIPAMSSLVDNCAIPRFVEISS